MSTFSPRNTLLLTPNERLARSLRARHDREQSEAGHLCWETLPASSWTAFVEELWEEHCLSSRESRTLLSAWQERVLWVRILEESQWGDTLLNLPAAARLAGEAWDLMRSYQLDERLLNPPIPWDEDTAAFLSWAADFREHCRKDNLLDRASLELTLSEIVRENRLDTRLLPAQLNLQGFSRLTPVQLRLLEALEAIGLGVERVELPSVEEPNWCRVESTDFLKEFESAARWLRQRLQSEDESIGIVVPELDSVRETLTRVFDEVLEPSESLASASTRGRSYSVSLGDPLTRWPISADALALLRLDMQFVPLPHLAVLFRSPFLGEAEEERSSRSLLEMRLWKNGAFRVGLDWIGKLSGRLDPEGAPTAYTCPRLRERLQAYKNLFSGLPPMQAPSEWASHFWACLECWGWPGERSLDSTEQQTATRWKELLAQLGSLDRIRPSVSRSEAWLLLRRAAEETIYQPDLGNSKRVEVLGYLEAAGLQFDSIWIMGMHDGAWPPPARPNPYIPRSLQREFELPHSSPERELAFAKEVTNLLLSGAPHGVVSTPTHSAEQELRPSPLIEFLPLVEQASLALWSSPTPIQEYWEARAVELISDPGPRSVGQDEVSRGGTSIFKLQALCPFRAFAGLRLDAASPEQPEEGLNAAQRGTLLHAALEALWKQVVSQRAWTEAPPSRRCEWIEGATAFALSRLEKERPDVLRGYFRELEGLRLAQLLESWMELESLRPPFKVIATESEVELEFAGVRFRAIIDRIDELTGGEQLILDYKTGLAKYKDWLGKRPGEPQLPLYCVSAGIPVHGIAFARVRPGEMLFDGLTLRLDMLPDVVPPELMSESPMPWSQLLSEWRKTLTELAVAFREGKAHVDPKDGAKTCRYCGLQALCRVGEQEELEE